MLRFRFFGFPVMVHWFFWLNCALLGGAISASSPRLLQALAGWMAVAFVSVLVHELGHALAMRHFGDGRVNIILYAFGGLTRGSRWFSRSQDFFVSAAGPFVQITAAVAVWWLADFWTPGHWLPAHMMRSFISISLFWAFLNLLPIVPLDGGHIALALFGPRRERFALMLSLVCAVAMAVLAIQRFGMISVLFFGMMAFNNWKQLRGEPQIPWMEAR